MQIQILKKYIQNKKPQIIKRYVQRILNNAFKKDSTPMQKIHSRQIPKKY